MTIMIVIFGYKLANQHKHCVITERGVEKKKAVKYLRKLCLQTSHILGEKNQCQHPRTAKPSNPDKLKVAHSMVHSKPNFQKQRNNLSHLRNP